ncbi:MAG: hypothetical protein LH609_03170, partial [Rudanella sp.]|nr:hypothetical protein [Rudanella sp.]
FGWIFGKIAGAFANRVVSEAVIATGQLTGKSYTSQQISKLLTGGADDTYKVIYRGMTGSESGSGPLFLAEDASYAASYARNANQGATAFRIPAQNVDILRQEGFLTTQMGVNTTTGRKGLEYVISNPAIKEVFLKATRVP